MLSPRPSFNGFPMRRPLPTILAIAAIAFVLVPGSSAPAQRRGDERELFRALARNFDRSQLAPDIRLLAPDGGVISGVRCATRPPAEFEREMVTGFAQREFARLDESRMSFRLLEIPVVFHVVRTRNGKWNVRRRQILDQVDVLNEAFVHRGFQFKLARIIRYNESIFAKRCLQRRVEERFKRRNAVRPDTTLNVYTCRPAGGVLGYSWFPSDWEEDSYMHGVVALHSTLPGGDAVPYDEGNTIVHEVGHWAGLYHTFEGGCAGQGDRVDDTPAQASPTFGCPPARDSCPGQPGEDPFDNFMDYSDDACMERFTVGQKRRMKEQTAVFRPALVPSE